MAINKNHEFEELNGVKCAVVEKNASPERVDFLKPLLEFNNYTVVVVASPLPKAAPAPKPVTPVAEGETAAPVVEIPAPPPAPTTFTIGVTDVRFNATNAIFGRMLRTKDGHIVTLAYWLQKETISNDEIPYYDAGKVLN
jgi:hypothetical protein